MGVSLFSADTMALTSLILQLRATRLRPLSIAWEGVGRRREGGEGREEKGGRRREGNLRFLTHNLSELISSCNISHDCNMPLMNISHTDLPSTKLYEPW